MRDWLIGNNCPINQSRSTYKIFDPYSNGKYRGILAPGL